jgi:alkylated DNA repair dioxygenase AlkB
VAAQQTELFSSAPNLPDGFVYSPDVLTTDEEKELVEEIAHLTFTEVKMHGVTARRRAVHLGYSYDFQAFAITPAADIPAFLRPLRARAADLAAIPVADFREALITEYAPGAGIGWHRDAPQFGIVVGVSLLSNCTVHFRPWPNRANEAKAKTVTAKADLARRSAYLLAGVARQKWQHRIPPMKSLRYSITFRTVRTS